MTVLVGCSTSNIIQTNTLITGCIEVINVPYKEVKQNVRFLLQSVIAVQTKSHSPEAKFIPALRFSGALSN